jgi:hypothetical protein
MRQQHPTVIVRGTASMDHPISEHVRTLQELVEEIQGFKSSDKDELALHALDQMLNSAQLAIAHYEIALKTEKELLSQRKKFNRTP